MYAFLLAVKRAVRSISFPILLIACTVIIAFAPALGREESLPPAGICDLDNTESSKRIINSLSDNGFVFYDDAELMREKIMMGELDCGMIIKKGFSDFLNRNELENSVIMITSPTSFSPQLYKNHLCAAVFSEVAPIITADAIGYEMLTTYNITKDDIITEYRKELDSGILFSFDIEYISSSHSDYTDSRQEAYLMFFASVLIFSAVMYSTCKLLNTDLFSLGRRIGIKAIMTSWVIPNIAVHILGIILSVVLAVPLEVLFLGSTAVASLLPAMLIYILLITAFGVLVAAILWDSTKMRSLTFIMLLMSLVFCPAYIDISAFFEASNLIRLIVPPYWLWYAADIPIVATVTLPLLLLAFTLFYIRLRQKIK